MNKAQLLEFWVQIKAKSVDPAWSAGKALEYLIIRAFELELGNEAVRWPYRVRLEEQEVEQIDGVIYHNGVSVLVECKDQQENVNIEPIAKLRNQLLRRPSGVIGVVFSQSGFTDPAVKLSQYLAPQVVLLWSGPEIEFALTNDYMAKGLIAKFRHCVEYGLVDYNIALEAQL